MRANGDKRNKQAWKARIAGLVLALFLAVGASIPYGASNADDPSSAPFALRSALASPGESEETAPYEPNRVLVELPEGTSPEEARETLASLDYVTTESFSDENMVDNYVLLELADGVDVEWAQSALAEEELVESAQPNFVYQLFVDDTYASGSGTAQYGYLNAIHAYDAWKTVRCEGTVSIAVLDTGCDLDHEDLQDNIIQEAAYNARTPTQSADDGHGHGTHVAGIAAAVTNNGKGVAGVSYNARIIPVKVLSDNGAGSTLDILRGLKYVDKLLDEHPEYNIRVLNLSFGTKLDGLQSSDVASMTKLQEMHDKGVLTVCAAGNASDGWELPYRCWPGDYSDNILNVMNAQGTTNSWSSYSLYSGSNYNEDGAATKDVTAPGTSIMSTVNTSDLYTRKTGTSMASPCVAGVAALLFAANPDLTPDEVADIICSTATDMEEAGFDNRTGYGLVNADAAVDAALNGPTLTGGRAMIVGRTLTLTPSIGNASNYTWTSDNETVASVQNGTVRGVSEGYAVISATNDQGATISHTVSVYDPQLEGVDHMAVDASSTFTLTSGLPGAWTWSSSNTDVAAVDGNGVVSALAPGSTTITVTLATDESVSISKDVVVNAGPLHVAYRAGVEGSTSWQAWKRDGEMSGTAGLGLRMEGLQIKLENAPCGGGIRYKSQLQSDGWEKTWKNDGTTSGYAPKKTGGKRLEAIQIELYGEMAERYDVWYHLQVQRFGWMGWVKNGEVSGTVGYAFRVEAIEVVLVEKDEGGSSSTPSIGHSVATSEANMLSFVRCRSYDNKVWQGAKGEGDVSGTRKQTKTCVRTGLAASSFSAADIDKGDSKILVRVYQLDKNGKNGTWSAWSSADDEEVGSKNAGAITGVQAKLTGKLASQYDLYYRVEVKEGSGSSACWLGWAKNGATAGQKNLNLEQLQFALVEKNGPAPTAENNVKQRWVLERWPCDYPKPSYRF